MKIKKTSFFKNGEQGKAKFYSIVDKLESLNNRNYCKHLVETFLGQTIVWSLEPIDSKKEFLFIFPGFRTSPLYWDFEKNLDLFLGERNVLLVETNGQPNPSDGSTPDIKGNGYGKWGQEIIKFFTDGIVDIAGASFGGLVCAKIAIEDESNLRSIHLLNPGCFKLVSMRPSVLWANLKPIFSPEREKINQFLMKIVFSYPNHQLKEEYHDLLLDFQELALTQYKDNTQKPYPMGKDLEKIKTSVFLYEGLSDQLLPAQKNITEAKKRIENLEILTYENVGHGIETYLPAIQDLKNNLAQ